MTSSSPEIIPSVEVVEEDQPELIPSVETVEEDQPELIPSVEIVEEDPQTPTMKTLNVADAYDWQFRADSAEQRLAIEGVKLEREKRRTRRLQSQISEYIEALARSTQDCSHAINQCQFVSSTNLALSQDLRKAKLMVETLEAVILLLYTSSKDKGGRLSTEASNGGVTVD